MLFNSIDFAIFLPIVFTIYWILNNKSLKLQNIILVITSYIFYGWWDWRFLILILFSSVIDFSLGILIFKENSFKKRKFYLLLSLFINLGLLGFFKYYNFFLDSFINLFTLFGNKFNSTTLNIILPVGISFYTFQTLSYTIDVYKKNIKPTKDIISFSAFVCFFPQLVAGPIERAKNLLPQFITKRRFNYKIAVDGLRQILYGLFKKIVIADNCAEHVNMIYRNFEDYSGSTLVLGAILFSFQVYADFSGYSDIAIGTSRLFGFNLKQNFAFPFFSESLPELWRRWHISLTTWFKDYIYIPLGGNRVSLLKQIRNILIVFIITGFWHGANWTFIVWGAINGLFVTQHILLVKEPNNKKRGLNNNFKKSINIIITFILFTSFLIVFRSENLTDALNYYRRIFTSSLFSFPIIRPLKLILILFLFMIIEWIGKNNLYGIENIKNIKSIFLRWCIYITILALILYFKGSPQQYIYFQF